MYSLKFDEIQKSGLNSEKQVLVRILTPKQKISVTATNISSNDGKVFFVLFDKETFMNTPIQSKSKEILNGTSFVTFKNLEKGEYSIICFHDSKIPKTP